jgi:hypothetical protein
VTISDRESFPASSRRTFRKTFPPQPGKAAGTIPGTIPRLVPVATFRRRKDLPAVTTTYEASLLARAHDLAEAAAELGGAIAAVLLGGARAAGLDPRSYAPLAGAALALGAARVAVYRAAGPAHPGDAAFLSDNADAEDDARDLLAAAGSLAEAVTAALDAALDDSDDAGEDDDEDLGDDAAERAALCEEALGVLGELEQRLRHAIARLQAVPAALGETYESVYALIRSGGRMPREGRWITGEDHRPPRQYLRLLAARRGAPAAAGRTS